MENITNFSRVLNTVTQYSSVYKTFGFITITIGVVGIVGSLLCMWTILKSQTSQKSSSNVLFLNLCIATLVFCGVVCPVHAYTQIVQLASVLNRKSAARSCQFIAFTYFWSITASAYSHSVIALDRLFAVVFPGSRFFESKWSTTGLIAATWLVSAATFIPPLFGVGGSFGFSEDSMKCTFDSLKGRSYLIMFKVIYGFVPAIIMIVCYAVVFIKVAISARRIRMRRKVGAIAVASGLGTLTQAVRQRRALRGEVRVTKIAFTTCLGFISCYVPSAVFGFVVKTREVIQSPLGIALVFLLWIGCAVNPLLYTYLNSALRQKFSGWLARQTIVGSLFPHSHHSADIMTSKGPGLVDQRERQSSR